MATLTLTGRLVDITTAPVEDITNLTVKAPAPDAAGAGTITTQPRKVDLSPDGSFSLTVAEGTGWLYVEGPGWSDSIRFVAKAGMTLFEQARLNAGPWSIPLPLVEGAIEEITKALSAALEKLTETDGWPKGIINPEIYTLDTIPDGVWTVAAPDAAGFNLPLRERGHVRSVSFGGWKYQQYVTVVRGTPVVYHRSYNSGSWSQWVEFGVQENPWVKDALPNRADLNEVVTPGVYWVNSTTAFSNLVNAPEARSAPGVLTVTATTAGNGRIYQEFVLLPDTGLGDSSTFTRHRDASMAWSKWVDKSSAGASDSSDMSTGGRGSGFKTVPVAVTMGNSGTTHLATTGNYRFPLLNNAPITRWRLCVTTRRPRQGDLSGADVTLTKVAYGDHASNGAFSDAPTVVAENIHVPADGTTVKLPWVSGEFGAGVERLISISYTSNNDIGPLSLHGYCFDMGTADAADQAATGTARGSGPLDMWIEAETYSTTPVIAAIGDSTTASSGATRTTYDGWLNVYCREKSALPVHYASAGDTALNWVSNPEGYKATRWLDLDAPDSIIYNLGNNDVGGGANLQTIQQYVAAMMPILEKITPNIYAATLKPRTGQDPSQVQVRQSYNQWLLQERDFFRDVFDFNAATVAADGESLRAEYNSGDDTHLNSAGYVALAGAVTRPVTAPPVMYQSA